MTADAAAPGLVERSWGGALAVALRLILLLALVLIVLQSALVVHARPQDLVTGVYGMAEPKRFDPAAPLAASTGTALLFWPSARRCAHREYRATGSCRSVTSP